MTSQGRRLILLVAFAEKMWVWLEAGYGEAESSGVAF